MDTRETGPTISSGGDVLPMCFAPILSPSCGLNMKWAGARGKALLPSTDRNILWFWWTPIPVADPAHLVFTRYLLGAMPSGELGHSTLRTPPQDMQGKQLPFIPLPLSKWEADVTVPPVDSPG